MRTRSTQYITYMFKALVYYIIVFSLIVSPRISWLKKIVLRHSKTYFLF